MPLINVEDTVKVDVVAQGTPNTATCEEPKMASNSNIGAIINAFVATILSMVFFIFFFTGAPRPNKTPKRRAAV